MDLRDLVLASDTSTNDSTMPLISSFDSLPDLDKLRKVSARSDAPLSASMMDSIIRWRPPSVTCVKLIPANRSKPSVPALSAAVTSFTPMPSAENSSSSPRPASVPERSASPTNSSTAVPVSSAVPITLSIDAAIASKLSATV